VAFATTFHFQILATCQATTWLVITRVLAGHPSSGLSQAFCWSNFAILAICPHFSLVVSFDLDLKLNYAVESITCLLRANLPPCILHWFYETPPHVQVTCVHHQACAKWHPFGRHLTVFVDDNLNLCALFLFMLVNRFA